MKIRGKRIGVEKAKTRHAVIIAALIGKTSWNVTYFFPFGRHDKCGLFSFLKIYIFVAITTSFSKFVDLIKSNEKFLSVPYFTMTKNALPPALKPLQQSFSKRRVLSLHDIRETALVHFTFCSSELNWFTNIDIGERGKESQNSFPISAWRVFPVLFFENCNRFLCQKNKDKMSPLQESFSLLVYGPACQHRKILAWTSGPCGKMVEFSWLCFQEVTTRRPFFVQ